MEPPFAEARAQSCSLDRLANLSLALPEPKWRPPCSRSFDVLETGKEPRIKTMSVLELAGVAPIPATGKIGLQNLLYDSQQGQAGPGETPTR